jgi:DNA polymerase/3'-5' exonuclease PolX
MDYSKSHSYSEQTSEQGTQRKKETIKDDDELLMRELTPRIMEAETDEEDESKLSKDLSKNLHFNSTHYMNLYKSSEIDLRCLTDTNIESPQLGVVN